MNKTALIAGATTGIGKASALQLARDGFDLVLAGRNETKGKELVDEIEALGGRADFIRTDMTVEDDVIALVAHTVDTFGKIDYYLGNQGVIYPPKLFHDTTTDDVDMVLSTNVKGTFFGMKHVIKQMLTQPQGNITIMASSSGIRPETGFGVYSASKKAVLGLVHDAALEYAANNIRINAIAPGGIKTPLTDATIKSAIDRNFVQPRPTIPLLNGGDLGEPQDISAMVSHLASDASKYMTGSVISIDGGITL
ncbi:SDR family NAD(P)-dependent oxidoreductase [Nocardia acidivorans]|uniref:SDR family NAD(P)-dependent oxidoreductase n=1 Tax=Nocardia acidivorans TaxID=404580 RepID=UPI00083421D3|nr:SDR family NAD(P)-dependent oxidoreductase [Nocardia acidivorans]